MHLASQTRRKDGGQLVNIWAFKNKRPEISQYPCLFPLPRASGPSKSFVPDWLALYLAFVCLAITRFRTALEKLAIGSWETSPEGVASGNVILMDSGSHF